MDRQAFKNVPQSRQRAHTDTVHEGFDLIFAATRYRLKIIISLVSVLAIAWTETAQTMRPIRKRFFSYYE